jgi:hypothetical protein
MARTCGDGGVPAPRRVVGSNGEFIAMIKSLLTVAAVVVFIIAMTSGADADWHWHHWHHWYHWHHWS